MLPADCTIHTKSKATSCSEEEAVAKRKLAFVLDYPVGVIELQHNILMSSIPERYVNVCVFVDHPMLIMVTKATFHLLQIRTTTAMSKPVSHSTSLVATPAKLPLFENWTPLRDFRPAWLSSSSPCRSSDKAAASTANP